MPGACLRSWMPMVGQKVTKGDRLAVLEAMKWKHQPACPRVMGTRRPEVLAIVGDSRGGCSTWCG